jgi:hypothetical protein
MAAPVPRFLRQTRLNYLPSHCVIGSYLVESKGGANLYFDIIMLPAQQFQHMKSNVGLQQIMAPNPSPLPGLNPSFVVNDVRQVVVPADEPNPEAYAKNYFLVEFGLIHAHLPLREEFLSADHQVTRKQ